ncbi:MAG: PilZ domain-containing protein [Sandaracinaceae bacterium]
MIGQATLGTSQDVFRHRGARRRSERMAIHASVAVRGLRGDAHGFSINASEGGLRVALDRRYPCDAELEVDLRFPTGDVLRERARVVWSRAQPDGWLMGLAFVG